MDILKIFDWMTPADETPTSLQKWRYKVAASLSLLFLLLMGAPVWMELRFVDEAKSQEAHEAVQRDLSEIKGSVDALVKTDKERTERERLRDIRDIRESILSLQTRACRSEGELRTVLSEQVGSLRSQYRELAGEEFPLLTCPELLGE
jgi:hypothetical protein